MNPTAKLSALAVMTAIGFASCSTDELQEVNTGEGISFTSQVSRATPTTLSNLDGFYVYADAEGYKHMFLENMMAKKDGTGNTYSLEQKVTWPADVNKIYFWAYGPLEAGRSKADGGYLTPVITAQSQHIHDYIVDQSVEDGGTEQKDFVVTYAEAEKTPGNQVSLEFHHALSQIELKAKIGANPEQGRRVKIKGAWFVNINSTGDLQFKGDAASEYHHMNWTDLDLPVVYGCTLDAGTPLSTDDTAMIIGNEGSAKTSLMLIPQTLSRYQFPVSQVDAREGEPTTTAETNKEGAYILVLCRIETHHNSEVTNEGQAANPAIKPDSDLKGHTHQLYPIIKETVDGKLTPVYKEDAYGYVCVPVDINWVPGKKYVYTLQFCGRGSGAGQYAPTNLPSVLPVDDTHINNPAADGKKPGDNVLDNEISFKVDVLDWTPAETDIKAN